MKSINALLVLCCFFGLQVHTTAQEEEMDSLRMVLRSVQPDSSRAQAAFQLSRRFKQRSLDSAFYYLDLIPSFADTTQMSAFLVEYHYHASSLFFIKGDIDQAILALDRILAQPHPGDARIGRGEVMASKSQAYARQARWDEAMSVALEAVKVAEESKDLYGESMAYGTLGIVMRRQNRLDESIQYSKKAYEIAKEMGDERTAYGYLSNVAIIHSQRKNYDQSIPAFKEILAYAEQDGQLVMAAMSMTNLGLNYLETEVYDSSSVYLHQSMDIYQKIKSRDRMASVSSVMARLYNQQGLHQKAIDAVAPFEEYINESGNLSLQKNVSEHLKTAYEGLGRYRDALRYAHAYTSLQDSLHNEEVTKSVQEAEVKFDTDKKETEIEKLALQNELNQTKLYQQRTALVGTIGGMVLLSFLLYRIFGQKRQIESQKNIITQSLSEKEVLLREIHHRVKNNLQVISSLLRIQTFKSEDAAATDALKESQARVQSMSLIHQDLYQSDNLTGIKMKTYLERLIKNLFQTYSISSDRVQLQTDIEDLQLDVDTVVPLGLLINELITNALKYAFPDEGSGTIKVSLKEDGQQLILVISDDGVGLPQDKQLEKEGTFGKGLIKAFAKKLKGDLQVISSHGTIIKLVIDDYKKA